MRRTNQSPTSDRGNSSPLGAAIGVNGKRRANDWLCPNDHAQVTCSSPAHEAALRILLALREVLHRRGTLVLQAADFDGLLGATEFSWDAPRIYLDSAQTAAGWRSTLAHELLHALRGPVPRFMDRTEEVVVRHQAAQMLIPDGPALAMLDRTWSSDDIQAVAARHAVDYGTAEDALNPPTVPIPPVIPLPRNTDNRWS